MEEPSGGSEVVRGLPTIPPTIITVGNREKKFILPLYTSLILSTGDKSSRRGREAWMQGQPLPYAGVLWYRLVGLHAGNAWGAEPTDR